MSVESEQGIPIENIKHSEYSSPEEEELVLPSKRNNNGKPEEEHIYTIPPLSCKRLSYLILGLSFLAFGLAICFSVEIIFSTPYLQSCGISRSLTSFFWILGPSMTLFIQPIFGMISDRVYIPIFGRRRPYIIVGTIIISITMTLFANSKVFGNILYPHDPKKSETVSEINVSLSFFVLDGSLNLGNLFLKSLICDVIPQSQQMIANAVVGGFSMGFGSIFGFLLGSIPWKSFMPFTNEDIQILYFVVVVILLITTAITTIMIREKKELHLQSKSTKKINNNNNNNNIVLEEEKIKILEKEPEVENNNSNENNNNNQEAEEEKIFYFEMKDKKDLSFKIENIENNNNNNPKQSKNNKCCSCCTNLLKTMYSVCEVIFKLPFSFWLCFLIQSMTYFTKYIVYVYISLFVSTVVFKGNPDSPPGSKEKIDFEEGVRWSNYGGIFMAVSGIGYGVLLPFLLSFFTTRILWVGAQFLLGGAVLWGAFVSDVEEYAKYLCFFSFFFFGFAQTSMNTIPWAIVNVICKDSEYLKKKKAFVQTIFYATIMIPEILVSIIGGPSLKLISWMGISDLKGLFFVSGIVGWVSILFVMIIRMPKGMRASEKKKIGFCASCRCFVNLGRCFWRIFFKKKKEKEELEDDYE